MKKDIQVIDHLSNPGTLQALIVHRPDAHPMWEYYMLSLIHLRPIVGQDPPNLKYPDSSHEMHIIALNPDTVPDPKDVQTIKWLLPVNLVYQLRGKTDAFAESVFMAFANAIDKGELNPDTDCRQSQIMWLDKWMTAQ